MPALPLLQTTGDLIRCWWDHNGMSFICLRSKLPEPYTPKNSTLSSCLRHIRPVEVQVEGDDDVIGNGCYILFVNTCVPRVSSTRSPSECVVTLTGLYPNNRLMKTADVWTSLVGLRNKHTCSMDSVAGWWQHETNLFRWQQGACKKVNRDEMSVPRWMYVLNKLNVWQKSGIAPRNVCNSWENRCRCILRGKRNAQKESFRT